MTTKPQKIEEGWVESVRKELYEIASDVSLGYSFEEKPIMKVISDLLASERQRCVDSLPKKREKSLGTCFSDIWNEAIDQAKHNLEQTK